MRHRLIVMWVGLLAVLCWIASPTIYAGETITDLRLSHANNRFGFKLYAQLLKEQPSQNVFISPSSIAMALAMLYNGASGETQQAMSKAMELQGMTLEEVNQSNAQLKSFLENADPKVALIIANSLWGREGIAFKQEFFRICTESYGAEVKSLDFMSPMAPDIINSWVSRSTRGKIQQIIGDVRDSVLMLINAVYFKGEWSKQFDKASTHDGPFHLLDGRVTQSPMMMQSGDYEYFKGDQFQAIRLAYGQGRFGMYIFLPNQNSSLEAFNRSLDERTWEIWKAQFQVEGGSVTLPRFRLVYEAHLKDSLAALGMGPAFDSSRANFERIQAPPSGLYINEVKYKTFLEVNEEGTEAAAATAIGLDLGATHLPKEFSIVVDRPFFCVIVDELTESILFMGSVVEPQQ